MARNIFTLAIIGKGLLRIFSHPACMGIAALVAIVTLVIIVIGPEKFRPPPFQPPPAHHDDLIARMYGWRLDKERYTQPSHVNRWNAALLAFGERVPNTTLEPMTDQKAQDLADKDWGARWDQVAPMLKTVVTGTNGAETLEGTSSAELLVGLDGDDVLRGLGGNDELRGGDGDDTYTGGEGADRFVFFYDETGNKTLTDFAPGDVIVLKMSALRSGKAGGWPSVANIIADRVWQRGTRIYTYTLSKDLEVKTDRRLRAENFVVE